jgi:hypothetical protein
LGRPEAIIAAYATAIPGARQVGDGGPLIAWQGNQLSKLIAEQRASHALPA